MKIQPISPTDLIKLDNIDPLIIQSVNELLSERWDSSGATISISSIEERYLKLGGILPPNINLEKITLLYKSKGFNILQSSYESGSFAKSYVTVLIFTA